MLPGVSLCCQIALDSFVIFRQLQISIAVGEPGGEPFAGKVEVETGSAGVRGILLHNAHGVFQLHKAANGGQDTGTEGGEFLAGKPQFFGGEMKQRSHFIKKLL